VPSPVEIYLSRKQIKPTDLETWARKIKGSGKKLTTINGSFDLLHAGHLEMLYEASLQGDVLLVLLNTDASIQQYKSPKRPIVPLEGRRQMISALEFVDFVSWFDETDPRTVLEKVKPNVHVNGSEYGENCIEAEVVKKHGGKIHIVPLVPGFSTSNLIKKIIQTCV